MRGWAMLLLLVACGDGVQVNTDHDAGFPADDPLNVYVPIGQRCRDGGGLVCGNGTLGACISGVCKPQCFVTMTPRCNPPLTVHHWQIDENDRVCYCD